MDGNYHRDQRLIMASLERFEAAMERMEEQLAEAHVKLIEIGTERRRDERDLETLKAAADLASKSLTAAVARIASLEAAEAARVVAEQDAKTQGRWDRLLTILMGLAAGGGGAGIAHAIPFLT